MKKDIQLKTAAAAAAAAAAQDTQVVGLVEEGGGGKQGGGGGGGVVKPVCASVTCARELSKTSEPVLLVLPHYYLLCSTYEVYVRKRDSQIFFCLLCPLPPLPLS